MARTPRRLRNLNFPAQDAENVQLHEDNLQGPPEIDNILPERPHESTRSIKIIWPNRDVRQILGGFRVKNLSQLDGGKIIVETDENGIPNERSASILGQYLGQLAENSTFAPLNIPRWDNELFVKKKENMINHVEEKFVYPPETKQLTRDWILMTISKRWRTYKSRLKNKYFNRHERSLDEILKNVPKGVNAHQWEALIGMWCQDSHTKLCDKNTQCARQQKNSHTTGRKSHARLKKEMETLRNAKVHKIDLWDEAHKKKDGNYTNENTKTLMDTTYEELAKRKTNNNGSLSCKDYSEVFEGVIGKESKLRGYYDDKYWSQVKVSQGLTFVEQSEQEEKLQFALRSMGDNVEDIRDEVKMMRAFMAKKFPGEDWRNAMLAAENDEVDLFERVVDNDIRHESDNDLEESDGNAHAPPNTMQQSRLGNCTRTKEGFANSSIPHEHMIAKKVHTENCVEANQGCAESALPREQVTYQDNIEVFLFSTNPRNKNKVVAKGGLVSKDKTCVVGGDMLGDEYFGVAVHAVTNIGDERLLRPYENIHTVRDAIGCVVAWPRSYVKRAKKTALNQSQNNLDN